MFSPLCRSKLNEILAACHPVRVFPHAHNHWHFDSQSRSSMLFAACIAFSAFFGSSTAIAQSSSSNRRSETHPPWQAGQHAAHLPTFTRPQIMQHNTVTSLWLTYQDGVYDLTSFADVHPGSVERLLLACKSEHDICSWWHQLGYHNQRDVHRLLEKYRIGNVEDTQVLPCAMQPMAVDAVLRQHRAALNDSAFSFEPFIAETPIDMLHGHFYTPSEYHYVRNHFHVPLHLDWDSTFSIEGIGVPAKITNSDDEEGAEEGAHEDDDDDEDECGVSLRYRDLLRLPSIEKDIYLQCGGHRRIEYTRFGEPHGSKWNVGAIGNARYKGVLLRDVLASIGVDVDALYNSGESSLHVWFIGADSAPDGEAYGVSIPVYKALDPAGDVMLAYEQNGEPLTPDHGFPVRVIVPGWVGARSVKWIEQILIADRPCDLKSYTKSYRMTKDAASEMRALPVNSAILCPQNGDTLTVSTQDSVLQIEGEAHSGDGRQIIRVDVSIDGGQTWTDAVLLADGETTHNKHWSWVKWKCEIDVSALLQQLCKEEDINTTKTTTINIQCRAMDSSHNRQPASCAPDLTFNPKGYAANPHHSIDVNVSWV